MLVSHCPASQLRRCAGKGVPLAPPLAAPRNPHPHSTPPLFKCRMGLPPPSNRSGPVPELFITAAFESFWFVIICQLSDLWPPAFRIQISWIRIRIQPFYRIRTVSRLCRIRIQSVSRQRFFEETCNISNLKKVIGQAPGEAISDPEIRNNCLGAAFVCLDHDPLTQLKHCLHQSPWIFGYRSL